MRENSGNTKIKIIKLSKEKKMILVDFLNDVTNKYPKHDAKLIKNHFFFDKTARNKNNEFHKS